jgi:hypothetical protein
VPLACEDVGPELVIMHRIPGGWEAVSSAGVELRACELYEMPLDAGRDLQVCPAARSFVLCLVTGTIRTAKQHPRRCQVLGPNDSLAQGADLANLRWRDWGAPVATARGTDYGGGCRRCAYTSRCGSRRTADAKQTAATLSTHASGSAHVTAQA